MITSYEIRITRHPKTGNWHIDLTAGTSNTISHERTRRGYVSAEDAITSSRHLVKILVKDEGAGSESLEPTIDRVAAIHEAVETAAADHVRRCADSLRPHLYRSFLSGAIAALQAGFALDNSTIPPEVHTNWVRVAMGINPTPKVPADPYLTTR